MAKFPFCAAVFAVALQLCGCSSDLTLGPVTVEEQQALAAAANGTPRLQSGEKIRIVVYGEDKLSGDYVIDPGGFVVLPLVGRVHAAGLSTTALQDQLIRKLGGEYVKDPKVTVDVIEFRPFYLLGEVEKPGEYPFKGGLNVMTATALAGGITYRAARSSVLIRHPGEAGYREYPMDASVPVFPGDIIKVPERYF